VKVTKVVPDYKFNILSCN